MLVGMEDAPVVVEDVVCSLVPFPPDLDPSWSVFFPSWWRRRTWTAVQKDASRPPKRTLLLITPRTASPPPRPGTNHGSAGKDEKVDLHHRHDHHEDRHRDDGVDHDDLQWLSAWCQRHRPWLQQQLHQHGAIWFRGFHHHHHQDGRLDDNMLSPGLEKIRQALLLESESSISSVKYDHDDVDDDQEDDNAPRKIRTAHHHYPYRGASPRHSVAGSSAFYTTTDLPTHIPIAQHLECSFLEAVPQTLLLACRQAPQSMTGGETPLADFTQIYQDLPVAWRQRLRQKGLIYRRVHPPVSTREGAAGGPGGWTLLYKWFLPRTKLWQTNYNSPWPLVFGTNDPQQVEAMCRQEGLDCQWIRPAAAPAKVPPAGAPHETWSWVSHTPGQAFQIHPVTQQTVWFNHMQVFHWTTLPVELFLAWWRDPWHKGVYLLHCFSVSLVYLLQYGILRKSPPLQVLYGDDQSPLGFGEVWTLRRAIHRHLLCFPWQNGDLLWIDNLSMSHGRQPTYDTQRDIVVAWGPPWIKTNALLRSSTVQ